MFVYFFRQAPEAIAEFEHRGEIIKVSKRKIMLSIVRMTLSLMLTFMVMLLVPE